MDSDRDLEDQVDLVRGLVDSVQDQAALLVQDREEAYWAAACLAQDQEDPGLDQDLVGLVDLVPALEDLLDLRPLGQAAAAVWALDVMSQPVSMNPMTALKSGFCGDFEITSWPEAHPAVLLSGFITGFLQPQSAYLDTPKFSRKLSGRFWTGWFPI